MKNILITGASGFLGSNFIATNFKHFDNIYAISRKKIENFENVKYYNLDLTDAYKLKSFFEANNIDSIIHFAFDHTYNDNQKMIKSICNAAKDKNIKSITHISSISVLRIENKKIQFKLNNHFDPYSYTKRQVEKLLYKYQKNLNIKIIYPTIVYGQGGNWTKFFNRCVNSRIIGLPFKGNVINNNISIDNFSIKLMNSLNKSEDKIIIGEHNSTWEDLYQIHAKKIKLNIIETKNSYHDNYVKNKIFLIWHRTPLGIILTFLLSKYLKFKNVKSSNPDENETINYTTPIFSNRVIHSTNFEI